MLLAKLSAVSMFSLFLCHGAVLVLVLNPDALDKANLLLSLSHLLASSLLIDQPQMAQSKDG